MLNTIKYFKKAYIMSLASYKIPEGQKTIEIKDENKNGTNVDELYKKILEDGKISNEDIPYLTKVEKELSKLGIETAIKLRTAFGNQIEDILKTNGLKISNEKFLAKIVDSLKYVGKLPQGLEKVNINDLQNKIVKLDDGKLKIYDKNGARLGYITNAGKISIQRSILNTDDITTKQANNIDSTYEMNQALEGLNKIAEYNKEQLERAKAFTQVVNNKLEQKGIKAHLTIENGKVVASNNKYFTIPQKNPDGTFPKEVEDINKNILKNLANFEKYVESRLKVGEKYETYAELQKSTENKKAIAQEKPEAKTSNDKTLEKKDITFINGKDTYLPSSAYKEGYTHRLTKSEVINALDGKTVKEFQKINSLKVDGKIGEKTYKAILKALKIEK